MKKLLFALLFSFLLFNIAQSQDLEVIRKGAVVYEVERVREIVKNDTLYIPEGHIRVVVAKGWYYDNVAKFWTNGNFVKSSEEMVREGKALKVVKDDSWKTSGYYHLYNPKTKQIRVYLVGSSNNHKKTIYRIRGTYKSGAKVYDSVKRINDSKARAEYNKRKVGYRPIITWLPSGASMNVGPVVVSEDRRYIRMTINPFFSSVIGFKTFTYRK